MIPVAILVHVDQAAAIRAGKKTWGRHVVEIDPGPLTDAQRRTLASLSYTSDDPRKPLVFDINVGLTPIAEATPEVIPALLDAYSAAKAAKAAEQERIRRETIAAWLDRADDDLMFRRVSGEWGVRDAYHHRIHVSTDHDPRYKERHARLLAVARERNAAIDAERNAAEERRDAAKRAEAAAEATEMRAWVERHGTPRLKRCVAESFECAAIYRDERLLVDRPGFRWAGAREEFGEARNPPNAAFALLDEARAVDPSAKLVYGQIGPVEPDPNYDDEEGDKYGYLVTARFLGRVIVWQEFVSRSGLRVERD